MKGWALLAALATAGPAFAVPPALPPTVTQRLVSEFIRATTSNDLPAYSGLFSPDAKITVEPGSPINKSEWIRAASDDFTPARRTRFLSIIAGSIRTEGKVTTRIVFVEEEEHCRPTIAECFPVYRSEVINVANGEIVNLERSQELTHKLSADGVWTFLGH